MNDVMIRPIFLLHAVVAFSIAGLIWFVRIATYPLMGAIGA